MKNKLLKKTLSLVLSALMFLSACIALPAVVDSGTLTVSAANLTYGDYEYKVNEDITVKVNDDNVVTITKYTGSDSSVTIPSSINGRSVTYIGVDAFENCTSLTSITIPNSVTTICDGAFHDCTSLKSITIPNSVTRIGAGVFLSCTNLTDINVNSNNSNFSSKDGVLYDKSLHELICCPSGKQSITIPNSVTSIDNWAFLCCANLTEINVNSNNSNYSSLDGVLYDKSLHELICCPGGKQSILLPNSVKSIRDIAFADCTNLTSITIPNSVKSIGDSAFSGCTSLKSITIPNSVTSIGCYTFGNCTSLTSITIPNSVTSIGDYPFYGCKNLTIYGIPGSFAETWAKANNIPFCDVRFVKPPDDYRIYIESEYIVAGDTFTVGADKLGGNFTGTYYPGKVSWEIGDRSVIDFITIHDPKTGKDIPYYEDSTRLHLKAKKFGESTLTLKLDGKKVCTETIKIDYSDEELCKAPFRSYIFSSSHAAGYSKAFRVASDVLDELSYSDIQGIVGYSFMNADYYGLGIPLGYAHNFISTGEIYSRNDDEVLYRILAHYYSLESDSEDYNAQMKELILNGMNATKTWLTEDDFIEEMFKGTAFDKKTVSKSLDVAGTLYDLIAKTIEYKASKKEIAATILLISQFELDTVKKIEAMLSKSGDTSSSLFKAVQRLKKHVADPERFKKDEEFKLLCETVSTFVVETAVDATLAGIILNIINSVHKFLGNLYTSLGGITLDDLNDFIISFDFVDRMNSSFRKSEGLDDMRFAFDMYKSSVLTMLDYTNILIEGKTGMIFTNKNLKKHKNDYNDAYKAADCTFSDLLNDVRSSAYSIKTNVVSDALRKLGAEIGYNANTKVKPVKSTSSGSGTATTDTDVLYIPSNYSGYDIVKISDNGYKGKNNIKGIVLPDTVRTIGNYSFAECKNVTYVQLNENLEKIGNYAFSNCKSLESISIPGHIKIIGTGAFEGCSKIRFLSVGADSIGDKAFAGCTGLSEVRFNNRDTVIGRQVFEGCSDSLIITGYKNSTAEKYAKSNGINFMAIPEYVASLSIVSRPKKTTYKTGEELDTKGLALKAVFKDGSTKTVTDGWVVAYNTSKTGKSKAYIFYGEKSVSYDITVTKGTDPELTLDTASLNLFYGTGAQLSAQARSPFGISLPVSYSSSNDNIARVSSTGYVSAVGTGKAVITVSVPKSNVKTKCQVTVSGSKTLKSGSNENIVHFIAPKDNFYLISLSADSSNSDITILDEAMNTVAKTKTAKNKWKAALSGGTAYTIRTGKAKSIKINGFTVSNGVRILNEKNVQVTKLNGTVGKTVRLSAKPLSDNCIDDEYYWKSVDPSIASVSDEGVISFKKAGKTTIRVKTSHSVTKDIPVTVVSSTPLSNKAKVSSSSVTLGKTVTITGAASGGTAPYQYAVYYKKASSAKYTRVKSFSAVNTAAVKPSATGTYNIRVKVKDKTGKTVNKDFKIKVTKPLVNTAKLSANSLKLGSSLTVTASATGGTGGYKYAVYYKKASSGKWITAQAFKTNTTVRIKPSSAVKYDICVKVKDSSGRIAKKYMTVKVTKPLKNNSALSALTVKKGSAVKVIAKAAGGTGKYTYAVYYKKAASEKWITAQAFKANTTVRIKPSSAVKYDICVKVKDSSGSIAKKYFKLKVTK